MKLINVAYDYEYDDEDGLVDMGLVDILSVPDFIYNNIDDIVQGFFNWAEEVVCFENKAKYPEFWFELSNGETYMNIGTDHFVKWLNDNYFHCENKKSYIVEKDTKYNPEYPTAKF